MVFGLDPLPLLVEKALSNTSRIGRCFEELKRADSRTPLQEPLRAADAIFAMVPHAITQRARDDAEERDYFRMSCEVLATEIASRAELASAVYKCAIVRRLYDRCYKKIDTDVFNELVLVMSQMHCHNVRAYDDYFHTTVAKLIAEANTVK